MSSNKVKVLASVSILGIILLSVFLGVSLSRVRTIYDIRQFFPSEYQGFDEFEEVRKNFSLETSPNLIVLVSLMSGTWTNESSMKSLTAFSQKLAEMNSLHRVMALPLRDTVFQTNESIQIGKLVELMPPKQWSDTFRKDPLVTPLLLSEDQKTALIYAEFKSQDAATYPDLFTEIETVGKQILPNANLKISGVPAVQSSIQDLLKTELSRFLLLSIVVSVGLIVLIFHRFSGWLITLLTLLIANICVGGLMGFWDWPFSVLSTTLPILVAIVVVSQTVYSFFRLDEIEVHAASIDAIEADCNDRDLIPHHVITEAKTPAHHYRRSLSHAECVYQMTKDTFMPNFIGHFTTAVGFSTLTLTNVPLIQDYGKAVFTCVLFAWLLTTAAMFSLLVFMPSPTPRAWTRLRMDRIREHLRYHRPIVIGSIVVSLIFAGGILNLNWGARLFDDLPLAHPARTSMQKIDNELGGSVSLDIEISAPSADYWKQPENLRSVESILAEIRSLPGVGSALGLSNFLSIFSKSRTVPESSGAVSEILFLFSLNPATPIKNFLTPDEKRIRLAVLLRDLPSLESIQLTDRIKSLVAKEFPNLKQRYSGMASYIHPLNNDVSLTLMRGFLDAMFAIALVLVVLFRSIRWAWVACIPNLVPPFILFGLMSLSQVAIKPPLAIVFSISLGLAFNNTIYLLMRCRDLIKKTGQAPSMEKLLALEGPGCLFSTVVILVGFLVFLGAQFSMNIMFGTFMIIATLSGLFGDLIFFPSLLKWFPQLLFKRSELGED